MSTIADLDTDVAAAIIAQTACTQRMQSDYLADLGEVIPEGEYRFRLRVNAFQRPPLNVNASIYTCTVEVDWLCMVPFAAADGVYRDNAWADQLTLTDGTDVGFWTPLASVLDIDTDTAPTVTDTIERVGQLLRYTVTAQVRLQP